MTERLEECSVEELAFWGFASADEDLALRDEGPPLVYDLEERTARFGETIILFAKKIPWSPVNNRLIDQLVGAGTSVGANYCEADDGVSRADFKHRIGTCRKEARETKLFLRMVAVAEPSLKPEAREIWREAHALHRIFSRIWRNTKT
ncbi:MAG TPA: four helix bundle protein [Verrucomicrobiae bacterium]|nr:four helix bundle protein [Verrucomicrobiae bacterium]